MSRDVLDMIDGVVEQHGDAMRWHAGNPLQADLPLAGRDGPVYAVPTVAYEVWRSDEREAMEAFLRANGIDPADVSINDGGRIVVSRVSGALFVDVWAMDRNDGKAVQCENCPDCVRQRHVVVPLASTPPLVTGAWVEHA